MRLLLPAPLLLALLLALLVGSCSVAVRGLLEQPVPHVPGSPPVAGGFFPTLPAGAPLPDGDECARLVHRSSWEPRPENATAVAPVGDVVLRPSVNFVRRFSEELLPRVDGRFSGTTDETIQWASCKWGLSDDLVRAQAFVESTWRADARGDWTEDLSLCPPPERVTRPCPQSFGIMQIKARSFPGSYPLSVTSLPFSLDYALAQQRGCLEGLLFSSAGYRAGDLWGCVGAWFSGRWRDPASERRIARVQDVLEGRPWLAWQWTVQTGPGGDGTAAVFEEERA